MPFHPKTHSAQGEFVDDTLGVPTAPVGYAVQAAARNTTAERRYEGLPRMWKVVNRAQKGALKGKPFVVCVGGTLYPDDANGEDPASWLQPGDSMLMERDAVLAAFGAFMAPQLPDKQDVLMKYGGWEYDIQPTLDGKVAGKVPVSTVIGPPEHLPDAVIEPIAARTADKPAKYAIFDLYTKGQTFSKPQLLVSGEGEARHEGRRKDLVTV